MKFLRLIAPLALAILAFAAPANAACPSTGNTVGTDTAAIIADLNVICAAAPSGAGLSSAQLPATLGQKTKATSLAVTLASDEDILARLPASLGPKTGALSLSVTPSSDNGLGSVATITRTADVNAYTANDVIGAATGSTAAIQFTLGTGPGEYWITSADFEIDATIPISGEGGYNLWCYNVTPPSALGDNAPFDVAAGDRASRIAKIPLGTPVDEGSTLIVRTDSINTQVTLTSANIFCYLVTIGAYTPTASRVYVVTLHAVKAY